MKKIVKDRDVVVTIPEHRLSMENKAIELATPSVSNNADASKNRREARRLKEQARRNKKRGGDGGGKDGVLKNPLG